ncbi:MAG: hypothetical protein JWP57_4235 [Spirosoma sp.]|nr:hypothetical protein [Spirosoma sp.]
MTETSSPQKAASAAFLSSEQPTWYLKAWDGIDGNWIDLCSLVVAVGFMVYRWWKGNQAGKGYKLLSRRAGADLANGTAFFPLLVLGGSSFSSLLLTQLMHANKLILSMAGLCALLALLEEDPIPSPVAPPPPP